jgi:hypothetical protein
MHVGLTGGGLRRWQQRGIVALERPDDVKPCGRSVGESSLGDAKSSLGDAKSSLVDAKSSLGDANSSLGDAKSSLGDASRWVQRTTTLGWTLVETRRRARRRQMRVHWVSQPPYAASPGAEQGLHTYTLLQVPLLEHCYICF